MKTLGKIVFYIFLSILIFSFVIVVFRRQKQENNEIKVNVEDTGIKKRSRNVSNFHKVSVRGKGQMFINQGTTESLEIECESKTMKKIQTKVKNGVLEINVKNEKRKIFFGLITINSSGSKPIKYYLSLKKLDSIEICGALNIECDKLKTKNFELESSGYGNIYFKNLEAKSFVADISGAGKINIESGKIQNQKISISGVCSHYSPNIKSKNVEVSISGAGKAEVWATKELDVNISGIGKLTYYSSPETKVSSDISGLGKVKKLGVK